MMLIKRIIVIIVLLMIASSVNASPEIDRGESPEYIFYQGNSHYKNGMYDEAIAEYLKIIENGLESGNLYFNMGNAYFKKGGLGKAILFYERAIRFIPNDSDLKSNYKFAISKIKKNAPDTAASFINSILAKFNNITVDGLAILLSIFYICIILSCIGVMYFRDIKNPAILFILILTILFVLSAYSLYNRASTLQKEAIIVSDETEARFEPIESATIHFSLYEGMKVHILEATTDWMKVKRMDGKSGWIHKKSAEKIYNEKIKPSGGIYGGRLI